MIQEATIEIVFKDGSKKVFDKFSEADSVIDASERGLKLVWADENSIITQEVHIADYLYATYTPSIEEEAEPPVEEKKGFFAKW